MMQKNVYIFLILGFSLFFGSLNPFSSIEENENKYQIQDELGSFIFPTNDVSSSGRINTPSSEELFFRKNLGQFPDSITFHSLIKGGEIVFGQSKVSFTLNGQSFHLSFFGSNLRQPQGKKPLNGQSNYFWDNQVVSNVHHYSQIVYENLYEGISLNYKMTAEGLKYEFLVAPHGDINQIKLEYTNVDKIHVSDTKVEVTTSQITFVDEGLEVWYADTGEIIESIFMTVNKKINDQVPLIQFKLDEGYNSSRPIVIDPLLYSTYLGGAAEDDAYGLIFDDEGYVYITGATRSFNFPLLNALNSTNPSIGSRSGFLAKYSPTGALVFSTYFGGTFMDTALDIALDSNKNIVVCGYTMSDDFPIFKAVDSNFTDSGPILGIAGVEGFVTKFSSDGSTLIFSTYLGGSGSENDISLVLDDLNNIYIAGETLSTDFPITGNAFQKINHGGQDAFVVKMSSDGSQLIYSTYLGGSGDEGMPITDSSIALDSSNAVVITAATNSDDFPTTSNAYNRKHSGNYDIYVSKLSVDGSNLAYSTFIGGSDKDESSDLILDSSDNIYLTGSTLSNDFPLSLDAYNSTFGGGGGIFNNLFYLGDAFITKLSADGSELLISTYIGGETLDIGIAISLDSNHNIYIGGMTGSGTYPTTDDAINRTYTGGVVDAMVSVFASNGSTLLYSSFFGGSGAEWANFMTLDSSYNIGIAGKTFSYDLPMTVNANQSIYGGGEDAYFAIIEAPVTQIPQTTTTKKTPSDTTTNTETTTTTQTASSWTPLIVLMSITALLIIQKRIHNH